MHAFLADLLERYQRLARSAAEGAARAAPGLGADPAAAERCLRELVLAEAAMRHARDARSASAARPVQVAVIGPTQTGKSTVVNLLLGRQVAPVSPLAGFTVHPQGFWLAERDRDPAWLAALLPGWSRCAPQELSRQRLECYALTVIDRAGQEPSGLPPCVLWDTPDFDSLAARSYRRGVLEAAALADAVVLVLSKEKYSDLAVWEMVALLEPLARPLLICLNKLTPEAVGPITASLRQRLTDFGGHREQVPIAVIEYRPGLPAGPPAADLPGVSELRRQLAARLSAPAGQRGAAGVRVLVRRHWDGWVAPLRAEHAAAAEWGRLLEAALARFVEAYRRDYLDHPQRYDAFRRASLELLRLLEIPRIGGPMSGARRVVTWPARRALGAAGAWWRARRRRERVLHRLGAEAAVLQDAAEALLTSLQREAARRAGAAAPGRAVWRAVAQRMQAGDGRLRQVFAAALEEHHRQVTREIQAVANELHEELCRQPARLAALRTARATIDLGYLVLALKSGGLTMLDALWAPAAFAFTSLLMEGIAGLQMERAAAQLKSRLYQSVRKTLVQGLLRRELGRLTADLDRAGAFGIPAERLAEASAALRAWGGAGDE